MFYSVEIFRTSNLGGRSQITLIEQGKIEGRRRDEMVGWHH